MSHITTRKSAMKNQEAIKRACKRMPGAKYLGELGRNRREGRGIGVQLPGWRNPVVIKEDGTCSFDNYGGRWGSNETLDTFQQGYGVEAAKMQAEAEGHQFEEQKLPNGDIKCTVSLGGGTGYEGGGDASGWDV